jgi:hypothetical protein
MERWASNSLRVLGIIVTSIILVIGSLLLFLLTLCAWGGGLGGGGGQKDQAVGFAFGLVVLLTVGIFVIAKLGKGIARSTVVQHPSGVPVDTLLSTVPLHISPASQITIHYLIYAIVAEIGLSALSTFWKMRLMLGSSSYGHLGLFPAIFTFLAYQLPYAVLIMLLLRKPDRRSFAYAFAIPAVLLIQTLYSLPMMLAYLRQGPLAWIFTLLFFALECLILWLAWQASQRLGLHHDPPSLIVAGVSTFLYFGFLRHLVTPWLYRFLWR